METFEDQKKMPMSVKDWLLTLLIIAIPVVGIVMLFVYAFGNNENLNRQNWAKAQLIVLAIVVALLLLCLVVFGSIFAAAASS